MTVLISAALPGPAPIYSVPALSFAQYALHFLATISLFFLIPELYSRGQTTPQFLHPFSRGGTSQHERLI